jgi:hypothetical protein
VSVFRDWAADVQERMKAGDANATALARISFKPPAPMPQSREREVVAKLGVAWGEAFYDHLSGGGSGGSLPPIPTAGHVQEVIAQEDAIAAAAAERKAAVEASESEAGIAKDAAQRARADFKASLARYEAHVAREARERELAAREAETHFAPRREEPTDPAVARAIKKALKAAKGR